MRARRVAEHGVAGDRRRRVVVVADGERVEALVVHELARGRGDPVRIGRPEVPGRLEDRRVGPAQRQPVLQQVVRLQPRAAGLGRAVEALADHGHVLVSDRPPQRGHVGAVRRVQVTVGRVPMGQIGLRVLDDRRGQAGVGARRRRRREPAGEDEVRGDARAVFPHGHADPRAVEAGVVRAVGVRDRDRVAEVGDRGPVVEEDRAHRGRAGELADLVGRASDVHGGHAVVTGLTL